MGDSDDGIFVRIRGLPWSATEDDVVNFLSDCRLARGVSSVHFTYNRDGRLSGEAYVELATEDDRERACKHNNRHMGKRYIEVFPSRRGEMEYVVKRSGPPRTPSRGDAVLRLRGLPFGCTKEEIAQFFSGYEIVPNGITLVIDHQGRTAGDAYVQFASQEVADKASAKHMERIGHRYIEIFRSCLSDAQAAMGQPGPFYGSRPSRPGPYDRMDRGFGGPGPRGGYGGRPVKGLMEDDLVDPYRERGPRGDGNYDGPRGPRSDGGGSPPRPPSFRDRRTPHCVHMRGMPFQATERDIADFLRPLNPVDIVLHFSSNNRPSGEADVYFASHDEACEAMKRDKCNMNHRYVELFLNSTPARRPPSPVRPPSRGYDGGPPGGPFSDGDFYGGGGGVGGGGRDIGGRDGGGRDGGDRGGGGRDGGSRDGGRDGGSGYGGRPGGHSSGNWGGGPPRSPTYQQDNFFYGRGQGGGPSQGYGNSGDNGSGPGGYGGGSGSGYGGNGYSGGNGFGSSGGGSNYSGGNDYNTGGGGGSGYGGYGGGQGSYRGSNNYAAY